MLGLYEGTALVTIILGALKTWGYQVQPVEGQDSKPRFSPKPGGNCQHSGMTPMPDAMRKSNKFRMIMNCHFTVLFFIFAAVVAALDPRERLYNYNNNNDNR